MDSCANLSRRVIRRGVLLGIGADAESVLEIDTVILDWLAIQFLIDACTDQTLEAVNAENLRQRLGVGSVVVERFLGQRA